mmetsp:Transcript_38202/g.89637  ORF Transcript_38202/g.89637 Transcript_38202/m.89637 type:complete len:222 (-) Transcript_38202:453-1118(-)
MMEEISVRKAITNRKTRISCIVFTIRVMRMIRKTFKLEIPAIFSILPFTASRAVTMSTMISQMDVATMKTSSRLHIQSSRQNSRTPLATKRKANSMVKRAVKQYCITWICIGRISMEPMLICTSTPMKTAFSSTTVAKNQSKRGWPTSHCQQFSGLFMWSRLVPLQLANLLLELIPCAWSALSRSFKSACENVVNSLGVKVLRGVNESCTLGRLWNACSVG